jgi:hypothetical protein
MTRRLAPILAILALAGCGPSSTNRVSGSGTGSVMTLTEHSTCAEWQQTSTAERNAFIEKFVAGQVQPADRGVLVASQIGFECSLHSASAIGVLAAEGLKPSG